MKFSTYLQLLHRYLGSDKTRADYVLYISDLFLKQPHTKEELEEDENDEYNPLSKEKRTLEKIYSNESGYKLSMKSAKKLRSKYDPTKFYKEIRSSLSQTVKLKMIKELKLLGVSAQINNYEKKCADLYYCFLDNLSKGIDNCESLSSAQEPIYLNIQQNGNNEIANQYRIEALSFCKRHEKDLPLLPLCFISDSLMALRHNIRTLYNDYSLCSPEVKKAICILSKVEYRIIKIDHIQDCIDLFIEDIKRYSLGDSDFLYDGGKYLHKALEYGDLPIDNSDPYVFRPLFVSSHSNSSLTTYIGEYLYHPDDHPDWPKPIDMVWGEMNLDCCPLKDMVFWVMRLIISSIYQMPIGKYDENIYIEEFNLETYEDMYYYTLLVLYSRYGNHVET